MIASAVRQWDPERHARRLAPAGALLAVSGGCVGGVGGLLAALLGVGLLVLSCYSRRDGLLILGPLTHAELLRAARRRRPWMWRAVYALLAGFVIWLVITASAPGLLAWSPPYYPPAHIADLNHQIALWFGVALAVYAVFLTLQLMPSIVAEEREAKRWDLLLTTDLRPREILLGKATARLLLVVEPLLTVLPVFSLMPLLGGLSPVAVALYGVALLAIVVSTTAVAVFYSLFAETPQDARGHAIVWMLAYYVASTVAVAVLMSVGPFLLDAPLGLLVAGNPAAMTLPTAGTAGFEATLLASLPRFLAFHAGVTLLYGLMACRRLRFAVPWRRQSRKEARAVRRAEARRGPTPGDPVQAATATMRPPMGDRPLSWWTRFGHRRGPLGFGLKYHLRVNAIVFAAALAVQLSRPLLESRALGLGPLPRLPTLLPALLVWLLTLPLFLRPLSHAAGSIAGERQADTLTGVLLMPLTSREIVSAKWRGSVLESLSAYYRLLAFGLAATVAGCLHPLSLPILAVVVWPGMALAAAVGVLCSTAAKTPATAKRWTILAVAGGGSILLMGSVYVLADAGPDTGMSVATFVAVTLPPATTFFPALLSAAPAMRVEVTTAYAVSVLVGAVYQSLAAWGVFNLAVWRFERSRGR